MDQDALLITGGAILATVLFVVGFAWEVRRWRRQPGDASLGQTRPVDARAAVELPRSSLALQALRRVIDASIGMYLLRRLLGRPSTSSPNEPHDSVAALDENDVAGRIGAVVPPGPVVTRPTRIVVAGSAATAPMVAAVSTVDADGRSPSTGPDRRRLYGDTALAVAGLAAVLLLAVVVLPSLRAGAGQVLSATGTPENSDGIVVAVTASPPPAEVVVIAPSPGPTATRTVSPSPSQEPVVTATPKPTPKPTRRPVATPRPTSTPTSAPTPDPPTPTPTSTPAPDPPTPTPTSAPTPDPPTPTP